MSLCVTLLDCLHVAFIVHSIPHSRAHGSSSWSSCCLVLALAPFSWILVLFLSLFGV
jgi:hypothetical protein